jgi:hypothetical protein
MYASAGEHGCLNVCLLFVGFELLNTYRCLTCMYLPLTPPHPPSAGQETLRVFHEGSGLSSARSYKVKEVLESVPAKLTAVRDLMSQKINK